MLNLFLNEMPVHLPDDFSMTMNIKNPIFSEIGNYSYPFKIPNTPQNQFIIDFIHRIESTKNPYTQFNGRFEFNGIPVFNGTAKFRVFNKDSFEGTIYDREGDFNYRRKNMGLRDFQYYDYHFATEQLGVDFATGCNDKYYPVRHVAFPMIRDLKYNGDYAPPDNQLQYINYQDNSGVLTLLTYYYHHRTFIVPMVFLRSALYHIFNGLGYTIPADQDFFNDTDLNKLVIYNSLSNNTLCPDFTYKTTDIYAKMHLPKMSLNDFFTSLENFFNIRFFINESLKTVKIVSVDSIITSLEYVDFDKDVLSISTELETEFPGIMLSLKLDGGDSYAGTHLESEGTLFEALKPEVELLSQLPAWPSCEIGEIRYVKSITAYYQVTPNTYPPSWIVCTNDFWTRKFFRSPDKQEELPISSLYAPSFGTYSWGECGNALADWKDISLRLAFVRRYPSENFMCANHSTTNYNLWMKQESSVINNTVMSQWHKNTLEFKHNTRLVKVVKLMTVTEFQTLDFSKKVRIHGVNYLIKSIQVNFKKNLIAPAMLDLYKC